MDPLPLGAQYQNLTIGAGDNLSEGALRVELADIGFINQFFKRRLPPNNDTISIYAVRIGNSYYRTDPGGGDVRW